MTQALVRSILLILWLINWNAKTKSNSKDLAGVFELSRIVQTVQKQPNWQENEILSNELIPLFKRSPFCFRLNTVML